MMVGYFENWNVFEPRKVNPVSIELCRAEIAVITLITEKMPMVIPEVVRAERNLFAPNDLHAISTISKIIILRRSLVPKGFNGV